MQLPPAKEPRTRTVDVKHIKLDLQFDWQTKQAFGTAAITCLPLVPTDTIALDAGFMTINSVSLRKRLLKFDYAGGDKNDNLKIALDRVYRQNEEITVTIDYRTNWRNEVDANSPGGNDGKGLRFNAPTSNDPIKVREIWSFGEPESNRYWFPSYDAPNDLRTTELIATVDKHLTVISNGKLIKKTHKADGTRSFHYKADTPYANHLTSLAVGEYVNVKKRFEHVELNNYGYARERNWVDASTERLPDMVRFFSEKTGLKYPYPNYSQVFVQDIGASTGNSNMSFSTITENMVDDHPTHADYFYLWDLTEARALAGQWFGNYVSANDWSDAWLNKSLAHHLNCLYTDHKNGRAEWLLWVHAFDQNTYFGDWAVGVRRPLVTKHYDDATTMSSDNYSSIRGGLVLNLLRKHIGDETWWRAIRLFVTKNGGKSVTTKDLQTAIEETTGENFGWFFDQWIYRMGHPVFEVTKGYSNGTLTLNVRQTQQVDRNNPYPQTALFQGRVEIEIDGRLETVWLKPQRENVFAFHLDKQPDFVNFDHENTWIRELKYEQTFDELLAQFQNTKDALARQSAMRQLVQIAKDTKNPGDDKAKVRTALLNKLLSKEYWRVRSGILSSLVALDATGDATVQTLLTIIKNERSWLKANAIAFLGNTKDPKYVNIYLNALTDDSFRVINSAAVALGKTKDARAFDALVNLTKKPSMKSQSLLCALGGLKELGDPRGFDIAYKALSDASLPRWRLSSIPPTWDHRDSAAALIRSLGKSEQAYPLVLERFRTSLAQSDLNGILANVLLIITLADPRGQEAFDLLKERYKDDTRLMTTISQFELQFKDALKG